MSPVVARTSADLARRLHRCGGTLSRWRSRPDFPCRRSPPWTARDVERIRRWAAATLRETFSAEQRAADQAAEDAAVWRMLSDEDRAALADPDALAIAKELDVPPRGNFLPPT